MRGLLHTFYNPRGRHCFNQWKSITHPRTTLASSPRSPRNMQMIKAMTWREVCTWLNQVGIQVSRSPPTLLRTLKEGDVYIELVRQISPPWYVRHKVAQAHETCGVFMMVQHFFDSDLVISVVGCQKLNVIELRAGKAIEHLDLIETFKTLHAAVRASPNLYMTPPKQARAN